MIPFLQDSIDTLFLCVGRPNAFQPNSFGPNGADPRRELKTTSENILLSQRFRLFSRFQNLFLKRNFTNFLR
jgi:hypothetical protein